MLDLVLDLGSMMFMFFLGTWYAEWKQRRKALRAQPFRWECEECAKTGSAFKFSSNSAQVTLAQADAHKAKCH